jgi:hypothetical protein
MGTYVNNLRLLEITTGDESGTWGTKTNTNLELIADAFGSGTEAITTNADTHTTTIADGAADEGRAIFLKYTGTLDSACTITIAPNTVNKVWLIENATSGSQSIIISQGSGANITIGNGNIAAVLTDGAGSGAAVLDAFADLELSSTLTVAGNVDFNGDLDVDGTTNLDVVDIDGAVDMASTLAVAGVLTGASLDISGDIDIDGTSNLDVVDIDGAVDMASTLQVDGAVTGSSTIQGTTITATTAFVPDASDGAALGTTSLEFSDLYLADGAVIGFGDDQEVTLTHVHNTGLLLSSTDELEFGDSASRIYQSADGVLRIDGEVTLDLYGSTSVNVSNDLLLNSDASVLGFGVNNDVTLTHVHDTGLLLNSTMALQFNDASQYINAPSNAILDITATDEIELNATAIDLNGTLDVSGTSTLTGAVACSDTLAVTGDVNIDSRTLYVDASTDRVAVNSPSDAEMLANFTVTDATSRAPATSGNASGHVIIGNTNNYGMALGATSDGAYTWIQAQALDSAGVFRRFCLNPAGGNVGVNMTAPTVALHVTGAITATGAITGSSKSFKIDHPLDSMKDTHDLFHVSVESPRADLQYRGVVTLSGGNASVDLDESARMSDGTWEALCRDPQVFLQNDTGWSALKGSVSGSTLLISCKDSISNDTVSWMVVAERDDPTYLASTITDDDGLLIIEAEKPEDVEDGD